MTGEMARGTPSIGQRLAKGVRFSFQHITAIAIVIFPILAQYDFFASWISIGEVVLIALLLIEWIKRGFWINREAISFYVMIVIWCFASLMSAASNPSIDVVRQVELLIRYALHIVFALSLGSETKNSSVLTKGYFILTFLASSFLIVQYFSWYCLNVKILDGLPFFGFSWNDNAKISSSNALYRPSSFFSEPALFASYLIPSLFYLPRFTAHKKYRFLWYLNLMCVLLSTSTLGILGVGLALLTNFFNKKEPLKIKILSIVVITLILTYVEVKYGIISRQVFAKLFSQRSNLASSTGMRVELGWEIYKQIPFPYKFFGVGLNNVASFVNSIGGAVVTKEYSSSLTYIINSLGYVGLFSFLIPFAVLFVRKKDAATRVFILFMLLMLLGASVLIQGYFVLYLTILMYKRPDTYDVEKR